MELCDGDEDSDDETDSQALTISAMKAYRDGDYRQASSNFLKTLRREHGAGMGGVGTHRVMAISQVKGETGLVKPDAEDIRDKHNMAEIDSKVCG